MRQDFDSNIPRHEQLARVPTNKSGHKHMHRKGPGRAANDAAKKRINKAKRAAQIAAPFKAEIRAYWRGRRDTYPSRP